MTENNRKTEKSSRLVIVDSLIVMVAIAAGILWVSSPTQRLLGESAYSIRSAFHGLFAGIFMVTATIGLYQVLRLWSGISLNIRELELGSIVNALACFLTIALGNWLYIPYRAPSGPRSHFLASIPEIHEIFFEFKEFTALFTFPLAIAASYLICLYGERLNTNKPLRETTALLLLLNFFYFMVAFGLGAAITKLKSI